MPGMVWRTLRNGTLMRRPRLRAIGWSDHARYSRACQPGGRASASK